mgnify:CR=1 FL=1
MQSSAKLTRQSTHLTRTAWTEDLRQVIGDAVALLATPCAANHARGAGMLIVNGAIPVRIAREKAGLKDITRHDIRGMSAIRPDIHATARSSGQGSPSASLVLAYSAGC